jgi:hypothetical protein
MFMRVLLSVACVAGLSSLAEAQCSGAAGVPFNCAAGSTPGALDLFFGGSNSGANTVKFTGLQVATGVYAMASAVSGGGTTNFLRADGAWTAPAGNLTDSGTTLLTASSVTVPGTYNIALFDPTSNAIAATIQSCSSGSKWDQLFKDATGQAATHAITLTPSAGTIDGSSTALIGTAHGALHLHSNGNMCVIL